MPSLLDQVAGFAARSVLRDAVVRRVEDVNDQFRWLTLAANASWTPGCKVQIWIGGTRFRTYTPFAWDDESVSCLVYRHGPSAATTWADRLEEGETLHLWGPLGSVNLRSLDQAPLIVGDETSFAIAAAWRDYGSAEAVDHLFEVTSPDFAGEVLDRLGLGPHSLVVRTPDDGHHGDLSERVVDHVRRHPDAPLVLTGKAQTIKATRRALKDEGLAPAVRVKAYWDPNRSALD